jgi:hypothetical protein
MPHDAQGCSIQIRGWGTSVGGLAKQQDPYLELTGETRIRIEHSSSFMHDLVSF